MKKLLFFIPDIATAGGVEKIVANLASSLGGLGSYSVTILTCAPFKGVTFYPVSDNVAIYALDRPDYPTGVYQRIRWYKALIKPLSQFVTQHQIDIVFAEGSYLALTLALIKNKNVIKVGCEHISYKAVHVLHKFLRRLWYKKLDALVVLTKPDQQYFNAFMQNVYLIPNFIIPQPPITQNAALKILAACGRLEHQKGLDLLIQAFVTVNSKFPDWRLIIYGEGSKREYLTHLINKNGLSGNVELPGNTQNVINDLRDATIFVLPSRFEGFPLMLLEAMNLGLPCIGSAIDGTIEVIQDRVNGILVKPENSLALATAICELINDKPLQKKISGAAKATTDQFYMDNVVIEWEKLITHLANIKQL